MNNDKRLHSLVSIKDTYDNIIKVTGLGEIDNFFYSLTDEDYISLSKVYTPEQFKEHILSYKDFITKNNYVPYSFDNAISYEYTFHRTLYKRHMNTILDIIKDEIKFFSLTCLSDIEDIDSTILAPIKDHIYSLHKVVKTPTTNLTFENFLCGHRHINLYIIFYNNETDKFLYDNINNQYDSLDVFEDICLYTDTMTPLYISNNIKQKHRFYTNNYNIHKQLVQLGNKLNKTTLKISLLSTIMLTVTYLFYLVIKKY